MHICTHNHILQLLQHHNYFYSSQFIIMAYVFFLNADWVEIIPLLKFI